MTQEHDTKRQKIQDASSKLFDLIQQLLEHPETELTDQLAIIKRVLEGERGLKELTSEKLKPYVIAALDSQLANIRQFILEQFKRLSRTSDGIKYLKENGFIKKIAELLADSSVGVSERAAECIVEIVKLPEGVAVVFENDSILNILRIHLQKNDENLKFRVLDVIAQFAGLGDPVFGFIKKTDFLERLINELDTDDLLQQLNAIELLEKMSRSIEGIAFLTERGVLNKLIEFLKSDESILISKTLIYFGFVASRGDSHFSKIVNLPLKEILLEHMNNENAEATIPTIAAIAISPLGLQWLLNDSHFLNEFLYFASSSDLQLRLCFFNSMANLFEARSENDSQSELLSTLYSKISTDPPTTQLLLRYLKEPFLDLRMAIFRFIHSVVKHTWGLTTLIKFPGFSDFLLNRSTEITKEGKQWKYDIIQRIVEHKQGKEICGTLLYYEFVNYLKLGVTYVRAEAEVAIEKNVAQ